MESFGTWELVEGGKQQGAMVLCAGEAQARFSGPLEIRVGKERAGFVYKRQGLTGLYKCDRASDTGRLPSANYVLHLVYDARETCWYSIDAPRDLAGGAPAIVYWGYPAYRTYGNAVGEGSCMWERNLNGPGQAPHWQTWMPFNTKVLRW